MENNTGAARFTAALARQLNIALLDSGLNKTALSERSGIPTRTMRRYLNGERAIEVPDLLRICRALGVGVAEVIDAAEDSVN